MGIILNILIFKVKVLNVKRFILLKIFKGFVIVFILFSLSEK